MTRKVYFYFVLTFLLGVIIGGCGVFFFTWYSGPRPARFDRARIVAHLKRELNLSDSQIQQVTQIIDDAARKHQELEKQTNSQYEAFREEARNKIRQILDPEQKVKFDDMIRRFEQRRRARPHP
jgi:Spy/CpxP family protein refolding chaperone